MRKEGPCVPFPWPEGESVEALLETLMANPILLVPALLVAAMVVFAVLKRLLKAAAILAIAGGLYLLMVEYLNGGL